MKRSAQQAWEKFGLPVTIGVVVLVLTAAVLFAVNRGYDGFRNDTERKDQIRYFAHLIEEARYDIYNTDAQKYSDGTPTSLQMARTFRYEQLQRDVRSALDGRASQLTYDEVHALESVFMSGYPVWRGLDEPQIDWIFAYFESLEWLGLNPMAG